jgi:hypothetical protein
MPTLFVVSAEKYFSARILQITSDTVVSFIQESFLRILNLQLQRQRRSRQERF